REKAELSMVVRTHEVIFGYSYMEVKNRKLHEQFDAEASCSSHGGSGSEKPVFYGVSIFVDGYTVPSSQELRAYMLKHGGRFENYFSRQRVTHIICSNLPNSKVKNLRSFSRGLPVVKPTWVLDSVAAKKLLNCKLDNGSVWVMGQTGHTLSGRVISTFQSSLQ
ncbi:DNA repair protein REV1 isoform X1, partial [Tanacetum coccineum]